MKHFNALYLGLMSFFVVFGVRGMDLPKDQLLDLFNDANNAIKFCIMNKNNIITDTMEESNLTKTITNKIMQSYQTLATYGLGQEDLNQINNIGYTPDNISFFERLKTASLKASIATQPHLLCSLLENTFARFDCNNQIYQPIKTSPKVINEIAQKSKPDTLFLIERLKAKESKSKTPSKVYLQEYSKYLNDMYSFCDKGNQNLLEIIKKKVLAICGPKLPAEISNPQEEEFGKPSLNPLDISELMESKFHEPSEDELLESLATTTNELVKELKKISEPFKVENLDTVKESISFLIDKMYAQIPQIEKDIPKNSSRLLNLQIIKRNIGRLTQKTNTLDTEKIILLILKIKNKTIANIKKKDSPLALESSSLALKKTVTNLEIERAKENRKDIVEKLHQQDALLLNLANSKTINESYIALLKEHITTLQEYSSHLIAAEADRKEKTEKSIKKYQERLEKAISKVYKLLPYPFLNEPSLISLVFPQINLAIATNNKEKLTEAIQKFRDDNKHKITDIISLEQIVHNLLDTPAELKKSVKKLLLKSDNQNLCELVASFLHETYKHQLTNDDLSKKLAILANEDLLSILSDLELRRQILFSQSGIIRAIISEGLDQQKMQACLMILNKKCNFYPKINQDAAITKAIEDIASKAYSSLQTQQTPAERSRFIALTVKDLNFLVGTISQDELSIVNPEELETREKTQSPIKPEAFSGTPEIQKRKISNPTTNQQNQYQETPEGLWESKVFWNEPKKLYPIAPELLKGGISKSDAPAIETIGGSVAPAPVVSNIENIELLPELPLGETPDLVNILFAINKLMPKDNDTVSGSDLLDAAKSGERDYRHLVNPQHQYKSENVKGLKGKIIENIQKTLESTHNKYFMCPTIPFLLNQIYEQQKHPNNVTSLESAKYDFLLCLNALPDVVGNFKRINKHLIETIIFNGTLNKPKIQACLILLGSQCDKFYTQLNSSKFEKELNNIRIFYKNSANTLDTSNSVVKAITLLASLEPVFSDKLPSDITIDQLRIYQQRLKDYKETLKITRDEDNASIALIKINQLIEKKEKEEQLAQKTITPITTQEMPQSIIKPGQEIPTPSSAVTPETRQIPTKEQFEAMIIDNYRKTAQELIAKDYSSSSLENLRNALDELHTIRNSERVRDLDPQLENTMTSIETMIIDNYRKIANELIAKDYSSSSLENLQKSLQEISVIKNSEQLDDLDPKLENTMTSINELSKRLIDKTILDRDNSIPFDHFYNLALVIKNLESNINNDIDNEIFQSYSDKLLNDLKVLIDQIKNKGGEFKDLNEKSQVEGMIKLYLGQNLGQSEILKPYLDKVLQAISDIRATAIEPIPASVKVQPTIEIPKPIVEAPSVTVKSPAVAVEAAKPTPPAVTIPVATLPRAETALQLSQSAMPQSKSEEPQRPLEKIEEEIAQPIHNTNVVPQNIPQLSLEEHPVTYQELIDKMSALVNSPNKLDPKILNDICIYADELSKKAPIIKNDVLIEDNFIHLDKAMTLLHDIQIQIPNIENAVNKFVFEIAKEMTSLEKRIKADTQILIHEIENGNFSSLLEESNKDALMNDYFGQVSEKNDAIVAAKQDVSKAIDLYLEKTKELVSALASEQEQPQPNINPVSTAERVPAKIPGTSTSSSSTEEEPISVAKPIIPVITPKEDPSIPSTKEESNNTEIKVQDKTPTAQPTPPTVEAQGFLTSVGNAFNYLRNSIRSFWDSVWSTLNYAP